MGNSGWSVAQTYTLQERRAVDNLKRQGYEAFCPLNTRPSKTDITKLVEFPLFPGYVFVQIEPGRQWYGINSTVGVIRLLTERGREVPRPLFVPDRKISDIAALSMTVESPLSPGTLVRVRNRDNAFYETVGAVVDLDKQMRVTVMMHVFNRDVSIIFTNPADLEKL